MPVKQIVRNRVTERKESETLQISAAGCGFQNLNPRCGSIRNAVDRIAASSESMPAGTDCFGSNRDHWVLRIRQI
jgi:hypothetical protein